MMAFGAAFPKCKRALQLQTAHSICHINEVSTAPGGRWSEEITESVHLLIPPPRESEIIKLLVDSRNALDTCEHTTTWGSLGKLQEILGERLNLSVHQYCTVIGTKPGVSTLADLCTRPMD